jgi:hypothetical protein
MRRGRARARWRSRSWRGGSRSQRPRSAQTPACPMTPGPRGDAGPPRIVIDGPTLLGIGKPQVSAAASPTELRLGDKITLFVEVIFDESVAVALPAGLDLAPAFDELKRSSVDERRSDGTRKRVYQIQLQVWELGEFDLPPVQVTYSIGGESSWVVTNRVPLRVVGTIDAIDDPNALLGATPAGADQAPRLAMDRRAHDRRRAGGRRAGLVAGAALAGAPAAPDRRGPQPDRRGRAGAGRRRRPDPSPPPPPRAPGRPRPRRASWRSPSSDRPGWATPPAAPSTPSTPWPRRAPWSAISRPATSSWSARSGPSFSSATTCRAAIARPPSCARRWAAPASTRRAWPRPRPGSRSPTSSSSAALTTTMTAPPPWLRPRELIVRLDAGARR